MDDPLGSTRHWQEEAHRSGSWRLWLDTAVPGVGLETYQTAGTGVVAYVGLEMLGGVWAIVGTPELVAARAAGCSDIVLVACTLLIVSRFLLVACLLFLCCFFAGDGDEDALSAPREPKRPAPPPGVRMPRPNSQSLAPNEAAVATGASGGLQTAAAEAVGGSQTAAPGAAGSSQSSRTASLPTRGRELHKHMASAHADLLERLAGLEERGRLGQR